MESHIVYPRCWIWNFLAIRKVRELEMLANYGDYLSHEVQGFRNTLFIPGADEGEEEILSEPDLRLAIRNCGQKSRTFWNSLAIILVRPP